MHQPFPNPDIFNIWQVRNVFVPFNDGILDPDGNHGKFRPCIIYGWTDEISDFGRSIMVIPISSHGSGGPPNEADVKINHTYKGNQCFAQPYRLLTVQRSAVYEPVNIVITPPQQEDITDGVIAFLPDDQSPRTSIMIRAFFEDKSDTFR